jgi:hypothetical protein
MKRPSRLKQVRLLRRDWAGDGILTLFAGAVLVIAVLLPWANVEIQGQVNYSPTLPGDINGVLQTQWGTPAIVVALVVVALGVLVTLTTPRKFSWLLGVAIAACGIAAVADADAAASHLGWLSPGLGLYLTTFAGVLLVPIGLATGLVGWFVARAPAGASTVPPAPESAPPS